MPDQGEIPHRQERDLSQIFPSTHDFELIETLRWTRGGGYYLLAEHFARLETSAAALGFRYAADDLRRALDAIVADTSAEILRVRLTLARGGKIATSATPIALPAPGAIWRLAIAPTRFDSADPLLRHKTTRRAVYEDALVAAQQASGADEVIFCNERDELCEGARCNLFLADGEMLLTPPLRCGLLPGVLRTHLLQSGRAREALLRLEDISPERMLYMGNSVRGLVASEMIGEQEKTHVGTLSRSGKAQ